MLSRARWRVAYEVRSGRVEAGRAERDLHLALRRGGGGRERRLVRQWGGQHAHVRTVSLPPRLARVPFLIAWHDHEARLLPRNCLLQPLLARQAMRNAHVACVHPQEPWRAEHARSHIAPRDLPECPCSDDLRRGGSECSPVRLLSLGWVLDPDRYLVRANACSREAELVVAIRQVAYPQRHGTTLGRGEGTAAVIIRIIKPAPRFPQTTCVERAFVRLKAQH
mmetsp:Transcript_1893/g.4710  ORF Transcript_1893/g.4710 Transcript_1893/m.4710 type:complete len:223 (-) Transcript_1893:967-1635(-)